MSLWRGRLLLFILYELWLKNFPQVDCFHIIKVTLFCRNKCFILLILRIIKLVALNGVKSLCIKTEQHFGLHWREALQNNNSYNTHILIHTCVGAVSAYVSYSDYINTNHIYTLNYILHFIVKFIYTIIHNNGCITNF